MADLLAFGLILGVAWIGRGRGLAGMALLAGGLFGGYLAALLLFRPIGGLLGAVTGLPGILAYPLAGMAVLLITSAVVGRYARKHRRERAFRIEEGWEPPRSDEVGGMVLGATYGLVIALVVSWAGMSLTGLYGGRELSTVRNSVTGRLSTEAAHRAVAVGARAVVGDRFVASSVGRMVAEPYAAIEGLNGVMADSRMQQLLGSGVIQEAARERDPRRLAASPALTALAGDEAFASTMRTFGLVEGGSGAVDPAAVAEALVREAGPALRSVDVLARDPEVAAILESPAFREPWEQGDFLRLAGDVEFRRLFDRVLDELRRTR